LVPHIHILNAELSRAIGTRVCAASSTPLSCISAHVHWGTGSCALACAALWMTTCTFLQHAMELGNPSPRCAGINYGIGAPALAHAPGGFTCVRCVLVARGLRWVLLVPVTYYGQDEWL
jgi:hypothetical protein